VIFSKALFMNLKHYAVNNKLKESDVIREAIEEHLRRKGYQPNKVPKGSKPIY